VTSVTGDPPCTRSPAGIGKVPAEPARCDTAQGRITPLRRTSRPDDQESTLTALPALMPALVLPLPASAGGFSPPTIEEFFPPGFLFEGTPFEINRIMMLRILVAVILVVLFLLYVNRAKLVPTRGTGVAETALDLVRVSVAEQILGEKDGRRFLPLLATIFFGVFALNILGVIPFANIAATSVVGMPLLLAVVVYVVFLTVGLRAQGPVGYFRNTLFPSSVPWYIYPLYTPIELLAVFVLRPLTLTIRLLANMIAGHFLLVLSFKGTNYLFFEAGETWLIPFGAVTLFFGFAFTLFEIIVALLQAYIFALLSAVYIQSSLHADH
jgi:F-type H+-transporting ATPase subunit a